jgi:protein-S-isoprenylcysteine O-methyltransferase Ste14
MKNDKSTRPQVAPPSKPFSALGRKIFGVRLYVGLVVAAIGLEVLTPKPFSTEGQRAIQVAAMALIVGGIGLRAWGTGCAGGHTRSEAIEAPHLVTNGPFAYTRNPIYGGTMCLGLGMALLIGDPLAPVFAGAAFAILYVVIVPAEEAFLSQRFGDEYERYKRAVPRFFPRFRAWDGRSGGSFHWRALYGEAGIALLLGLIYGALLLKNVLTRVWAEGIALR